MKRIAVISLLVGALIAIFLVVHFDAAAVGHALAAVGWGGFGLICAYQLALITLMGAAWWVLVRGQPGAKPAVFAWGRLIRDSASEALPLSQVGGLVLGARAVSLMGIPAAVASASTIVDVTTEVVAQLLYLGIGLAFFESLRPGTPFVLPALVGAVVMAILVSIFIFLQRRGAGGILTRLAARLPARWQPTLRQMEAAHVATRVIHARPGGLFLSGFLHLVAWAASGLQAWLALHLMGVPLGIAPVLVIESIVYGARSAAFLVPNALGVQEGAYIALGSLFGLGPDVALALSLLKRGRDIIIAIPALLMWQAVEARRVWTPSTPACAARPEQDT